MLNNSVSAALMEKSLSAVWKRSQVAMHNIANEDTPGYKAQRLQFETLLRREMNPKTLVTAFDKTSDIDHIRSVQPRVYEDKITIGRADGNNVDIDAEQMELARLQIQQNALTGKINGHYAQIRYALTGGR